LVYFVALPLDDFTGYRLALIFSFRSIDPWRLPLNERSGLAINVAVGWVGYLLPRRTTIAPAAGPGQLSGG